MIERAVKFIPTRSPKVSLKFHLINEGLNQVLWFDHNFLGIKSSKRSSIFEFSSFPVCVFVCFKKVKIKKTNICATFPHLDSAFLIQ